MSEYKRMVSYLYKYENGAKGRNIGYVRIEVRQGDLKLLVSIKDPKGLNDVSYKVYFYYHEGRSLKGISGGEMLLKRGEGVFRTTTKEEAVFQSKYSLDDMGGMIIYYNNELAYGTEWDDHAIQMHYFEVDSMAIPPVPKEENRESAETDIQKEEGIAGIESRKEQQTPEQNDSNSLNHGQTQKQSQTQDQSNSELNTVHKGSIRQTEDAQQQVSQTRQMQTTQQQANQTRQMQQTQQQVSQTRQMQQTQQQVSQTRQMQQTQQQVSQTRQMQQTQQQVSQASQVQQTQQQVGQTSQMQPMQQAQPTQRQAQPVPQQNYQVQQPKQSDYIEQGPIKVQNSQDVIKGREAEAQEMVSNGTSNAAQQRNGLSQPRSVVNLGRTAPQINQEVEAAEIATEIVTEAAISQEDLKAESLDVQYDSATDSLVMEKRTNNPQTNGQLFNNQQQNRNKGPQPYGNYWQNDRRQFNNRQQNGRRMRQNQASSAQPEMMIQNSSNTPNNNMNLNNNTNPNNNVNRNSNPNPNNNANRNSNPNPNNNANRNSNPNPNNNATQSSNANPNNSNWQGQQAQSSIQSYIMESLLKNNSQGNFPNTAGMSSQGSGPNEFQSKLEQFTEVIQQMQQVMQPSTTPNGQSRGNMQKQATPTKTAASKPIPEAAPTPTSAAESVSVPTSSPVFGPIADAAPESASISAPSAEPTNTRQEGDTSDSSQMEALFRDCPRLPHGGNNQIIESVRITPQDIGKLDRSNWKFGNNSFLIHGFYNYHYLMLGRIGNERGEVKEVLGVPGIFDNRAKYMAGQFGFSQFIPAKPTPLNTGAFGYWIVELSRENRI